MAKRAGPEPTSEQVSARMARHPRRNTMPELAVRQLLHSSGLRYRVDVAPCPGLRRKADIVFTRARIAVFIDGCYWHGCPDHCRPSGRNLDWWRAKIAANHVRDEDTDAVLRSAGWTVVRAWAHEDPAVVASDVKELLRRRSN